MNSLIEYNGLCDRLPGNIKIFKEFIVTDKLKLPKDKNKIRDIIKISINSKMVSGNLIKTCSGISLEGENLEGYKYMGKGIFDVKVYYEEDSDAGRLGLLSKKIKFFEAIGVPRETSNSKKNNMCIYVEDIYTEIVNTGEIFIAITAMCVFDWGDKNE